MHTLYLGCENWINSGRTSGLPLLNELTKNFAIWGSLRKTDAEIDSAENKIK